MKYTVEQLDAMPVGTVLMNNCEKITWESRDIDRYAIKRSARATRTMFWSNCMGWLSPAQVAEMNFTHRADPQELDDAR